MLRIHIRDPGSGAVFTPGSKSGISFPGSRIPDPKPLFLWEISNNFLG
jgi:hypothetical protein